MQTLDMDHTLLDAIAACKPTAIHVGRFFLSWNSVMTMAYEPFSATLLEIKDLIGNRMPMLNKENRGSKWPKTTLGCFECDQRPSMEQLDKIHDICEKYNYDLGNLTPDARRIPINNIKIVTFACRTLARRHESIEIELNKNLDRDDAKLPPEHDHAKLVRKVLDDFKKDNLGNYMKNLHPEGRTFRDYYNIDHMEQTLIADISFSPDVLEVVRAFQNELNDEWPCLYRWFPESSWHLTIRALVPKA